MPMELQSVGAARSRSPRRDKVGAHRSFASRIAASVASTALGIARAAVVRLPEGRRRAFVVSALNVLEVYATDPADLERVGAAMCTEVDRIGGLVRKMAQQVSQLPDVVPAAALRRGLQELQGNNRPRDTHDIEQQLMRAFPNVKISILRVCGTGCMGEVSEVLVLGDMDGLPRSGQEGIKCAAKTVNMDQQRLFEEDFGLFARLSDAMSIPLICLRRIDSQVAAELEAVVSKITDMANNADFVDGMRRGFDMKVEEEQSLTGATMLSRLGDVFFAPRMYAASRSEGVLLMELVEGQLLQDSTAEVPPEFVRDFVGLYVGMIHERYVHQDLHPANIIVHGRSADARAFALIDWGEVMKVPDEHLEDMEVLLRTIVAGRWMGEEHDSLQELFLRFGVVVKSDRVAQEHNYQMLANMFNVVHALRGDPQVNTATLIGATIFRAPAWLEAWQKAANAFVISLQAVGTSPETADAELRRALELPAPATGSDGLSR